MQSMLKLYTWSLETARVASMSPHASLHQRSKPLSCNTWEAKEELNLEIRYIIRIAVTDLLDLRMTSDDGDLPSPSPH